MKTIAIHHLIGLVYTQAEAAQFLGIKPATYTRAISTRDSTYTDYMIRMQRRAIIDLKKTKHKHILAAITEAKIE